MEAPKIFESEYRFCLILWEAEPINSTELVRLCRERLWSGPSRGRSRPSWRRLPGGRA